MEDGCRDEQICVHATQKPAFVHLSFHPSIAGSVTLISLSVPGRM